MSSLVVYFQSCRDFLSIFCLRSLVFLLCCNSPFIGKFQKHSACKAGPNGKEIPAWVNWGCFQWPLGAKRWGKCRTNVIRIFESGWKVQNIFKISYNFWRKTNKWFYFVHWMIIAFICLKTESCIVSCWITWPHLGLL